MKPAAPSDFPAVFARLRRILEPHARKLKVAQNSATCYCLEGKVGPAMLRVWGGKVKRSTIPVAWVQIGKAYVSFHHMALYGSAPLNAAMSAKLKARMQGKSCLNFKQPDEALFKELEALTARGCEGMRMAGFIE